MALFIILIPVSSLSFAPIFPVERRKIWALQLITITPLVPLTEEVLLDAPSLPGTCFKVLGGQGYDDSGVTDLGLLIDFGDSVLRRRHGGEIEFFIALKKDGHMAKMSRQSLNVSLVELLLPYARSNQFLNE